MDTNYRHTSTNIPAWARIREPLRWDEILDELENEIPAMEDKEPAAAQKQTEPEKVGGKRRVS